VQWRGGAHIVGTNLWCDASRPRDACFVSNAYAVKPQRHGQLVATAETLALLSRSDPTAVAGTELPVPLGRPFTLGTTRLELFGSGYSAGAASLLVDLTQAPGSLGGATGKRVVYAGKVNPRGGDLGGAADMRHGDVLIIDAAYGHPRFRFPDAEAIAPRVMTFANDCLRSGHTPVLAVATPGKGIDVAARLEAMGRPLRAHRLIHQCAQRLRGAGVGVPDLRRFGKAPAKDELLLWLRRDLAKLDDWRDRTRVALLSGLAQDPETAEDSDFDAGFAWSACADYAGLVRYIQASGAAEVYLTGRYAEVLATRLDGAPGGPRVTALGPHRQLSLF